MAFLDAPEMRPPQGRKALKSRRVLSHSTSLVPRTMSSGKGALILAHSLPQTLLTRDESLWFTTKIEADALINSS